MIGITSLTALMVLAGNPGDPPTVHYKAKAVTRSWEPIALAEVERVVEASALAPLTAGAAMRLKKTSFSELKSGDYSMTIHGRFIEEAELFAVYITFGPGKRSDLPSFYVTDTSEPLGRQKRAVMEKRIKETAARAAHRMAAILTPRLEQARLAAGPAPVLSQTLPLAWGEVEVPEVRGGTPDIRALLDVRNPDHVRFKALAALKGHVFDQQPARNAVERCVLTDPQPKLRSQCVRALAPVSRNHSPTQRVLLHAMRTDVDDHVLSELTEASSSFVGLSRSETIATWLELVASEATPERSAERVAKLISKEGDVPNLDFAAAACLQQTALVAGRKHGCAQYLLSNIPPRRRAAVVWKYLETASAWGTYGSLTFDKVVQQTTGRKSGGVVLDGYGELMLSIAERRTAGRLRRKALRLGAKHAAATPANLQRILRLAYEPLLATDAPHAAVSMIKRADDLRQMGIGALRKIRENAKYLPRPNHGNPYQVLDKTIARLQKKKRR